MADPRMSSFQVSSRAIGIDRKRSVLKSDPGWYVVDPTTTFRAGMLVSLDANERVTRCVGTHVLGFALYNNCTTEYATVTGEYIQLNGAVATNLKHANLLYPLSPAVPGAGVRVGAALTGAAYAETTGADNDYVVSYVNGTIARVVATTTIPDGGYVYVNYMYPLTEADLDFEGRNFWNLTNDVNVSDGKCAIATDATTIFTTAYDPHLTFTVNQLLYAGTTAQGCEGLVTTVSTGANAYIGRVVQIPTAADPWLGLRFVNVAIV